MSDALSTVAAALAAVPMTEFVEGRTRPVITSLGSMVDDADITRMAAAALRAAAAPVLEMHAPNAQGDCPKCRCECCDDPEVWPCPTARALGAKA